MPEDRIPPLFTFRDLNLLHHRAIAAKRPDYIAYITWVAKSYEGALRRRRADTLRPVVAPLACSKSSEAEPPDTDTYAEGR